MVQTLMKCRILWYFFWVFTVYLSTCLGVLHNEPRSDRRGFLAIKVKSEIFTEKERPSCCEQLQENLKRLSLQITDMSV